MKKILLVIYGFILLSTTIFGQNTTFEYQGYSIGASLSGQSYFPRAMMPEVAKVGSEYIIYFAYESPTESFIMYATSNDMNTWQIGDTVLAGSVDTTDREFIIGGPRVIELANGQYRLFYRASQKYSSEPYYHLRSAISNDGKNFTREGICIEINNYDSNSYFKHVGHSEVYYDAGGNLRAFLTAKDTTMGGQPDNIFTAESADGGLSWSNFTTKYIACHDPVVIIDSSQNYHAYFTYLSTAFKTVTSGDGTTWPSMTDELVMIQAGDTITESTSPVKIADLGAGVDANGKIVIFSNYASAVGPWTHIAYWEEMNPIGINTHLQNASIKVFPNPTSGIVNIGNIPSNMTNYSVRVTNLLGQIVMGTNEASKFYLPGNIKKGAYTLSIIDEGKALFYHQNIIVIK